MRLILDIVKRAEKVINMSVFDNLPSDSVLPDIGISDYGNTAQEPLPVPGESPMVGPGGKTKIVPTSKDGDSYQGTIGYGFMVNGAVTKSQGGAPGNGNGSITDNNGTGNSSGIPAAQPIEPLVFGDPNDTGLDFKDGTSRDTVTIQGAGVGDIKSTDITKPNPMGG